MCRPHGKRSAQARSCKPGRRRQGCERLALASPVRDERTANLQQPGPRSADARVAWLRSIRPHGQRVSRTASFRTLRHPVQLDSALESPCLYPPLAATEPAASAKRAAGQGLPWPAPRGGRQAQRGGGWRQPSPRRQAKRAAPATARRRQGLKPFRGETPQASRCAARKPVPQGRRPETCFKDSRSAARVHSELLPSELVPHRSTSVRHLDERKVRTPQCKASAKNDTSSPGSWGKSKFRLTETR